MTKLVSSKNDPLRVDPTFWKGCSFHIFFTQIFKRQIEAKLSVIISDVPRQNHDRIDIRTSRHTIRHVNFDLP